MKKDLAKEINNYLDGFLGYDYSGIRPDKITSILDKLPDEVWAMLDKVKEDCPECEGIGYLEDDDTGEPNPPVGGIRCSNCKDGKVYNLDRLVVLSKDQKVVTIQSIDVSI